jgi:L-ribulose-5-phosphate 4-epimerase
MTEGYTKFNYEWIKAEPLPNELIRDISEIRTELFRKGWIGCGPDGIGYGNISKRYAVNEFIISGTQTGDIEILDNNHFTLVTKFDIDRNYVECRGPVKASSETLTHAVIYENLPEVGSVIHIHNLKNWELLKNTIPTTGDFAEYGTPALAYEIERLIHETNLSEIKIFVMSGHTEGIVSFGNSPKEAFEVLLKYLM